MIQKKPGNLVNIRATGRLLLKGNYMNWSKWSKWLPALYFIAIIGIVIAFALLVGCSSIQPKSDIYYPPPPGSKTTDTGQLASDSLDIYWLLRGAMRK